VIGWEDRLQNDLYCVEWDVKPYYTIWSRGQYWKAKIQVQGKSYNFTLKPKIKILAPLP